MKRAPRSLQHHVLYRKYHGRDSEISALLGKCGVNCAGKSLVFVATKKQGEKVKDLLDAAGVNCEFFHGGRDATQREVIVQRFSTNNSDNGGGGLDCLICTNAFGMGMDIPNIRLVFHWHHSASVEDYAQEFGRAGRDGHQSLAVVFSSDDDCKLLNFMAKKSVEKSKLPYAARSTALDKRMKSIERINSFVTQHDQCFTHLLLDDLGAAEMRIPKISRFFLELAFVKRQGKTKREVCCDGCWRKHHEGPVSNFGRHVVGLMDLP